MIDEKRVSQALKYLATTDEPAANAKGLMIGLEKQEKTILGMEYLSAQGGSVAERDAIARNSSAYAEWRHKYENAVAEYELFKNKRNTEDTIIRVWQSEGANRRTGNV